jgi:hypothetical protein
MEAIMLEDTDYQELLAELEEEQKNIQRMIVWVKGRMQQQGEFPEAVVTVGPKTGVDGRVRFPRIGIAPDTFFRMSVPDAIKKYLNIVKAPRTAQDITAGLDAGGLTHQAKNLYATVYPTLLRMEHAGDVARVGNRQWALSEWYPGGRKTEKAPEGKEDSEK